MRILVTGGAGTIGSTLVQGLSYHPKVTSITVLDNLSSAQNGFFFQTQLIKEKIRFVEGDILETRKMQKLVKEVDIVVHMASLDSSSEENHLIQHMEQVNHWGTAELSYAIENTPVQKVIYLSTAGVYGFSNEIRTETTQPHPMTSFAHSKLRGESHITRLGHQVDALVFRIGTIVGLGPVTKIKGVANQFFWDALTKNRLSVHGNGKQVRPVSSLAYVVQSIEKSILEKVDAGVYNLVQSNLQVLDILEVLKNLKPDLEFIFSNHHLELPSVLMATDFGNIFPQPTLDLAHAYTTLLQRASLN